MADPSPRALTLTARWLFPVSCPPLERGTLTIADRRIVAVQAHGLRRADLDLGNAAVLPGLVNAHTHLDLSGLRGAAPYTGDFTGWLGAVLRHRRARSPEQVQADIRTGLDECLRTGTTLVGDVSAGGASWEALAASPLRAVVFHELIGLPAGRAEQAVAAGRDWFEAHPATPTCRPGLSPHAPYSAGDRLFMLAGMLARLRSAPLMTHLAETTAELELLQSQGGPFVPFLQGLGVWAPRAPTSTSSRRRGSCTGPVPTCPATRCCAWPPSPAPRPWAGPARSAASPPASRPTWSSCRCPTATRPIRTNWSSAATGPWSG
jgi:cytosine/adenosine deaminase-related metal-dependent hydrolase